jgi:hypothetical protein
MEHETTPYTVSVYAPSHISLRRSYQPASPSLPGISRTEHQASRGAAPQRQQTQARREVLAQALERALSQLRGESLVVAMLAYGLGVRLSELRDLRVRDISLRDRRIWLGGRFKALPKMVMDDLREHLQERACGRDATGLGGEHGIEGIWRREDPVFSAEAIDLVSATIRCLGLPLIASQASSDASLKALGWFHKRRAAVLGLRCESALELLDKGPRIVRRGFGGRIDAYYVWRAAQELF